jgi:hypothetical protein
MTPPTEREIDVAFRELVVKAMEIAHRLALEGVYRISFGETADDYLSAYQGIFEEAFIEATDELQMVRDEAGRPSHPS